MLLQYSSGFFLRDFEELFLVQTKASAAQKITPLLSGMRFFMVFRDVVSGDTQGVGSVNQSVPLLSGIQFFMIFRDVVSGDTQAVGSMKKVHPS